MHPVDHPVATRPIGRRRIRLSAIGLLVAAAATLSACAGSPASDAPIESAIGGGDACVDAAALRTAVDDLKAIDLTAVGTDGLTAAVDDVQAAGTALRSSVAADLTPEVTALETALTGLGTAVEGIGEGGEVGAAANDIRTAVTAVDTAASALVSDVQAGC
jgi:hypothetical protein